MRETLATKLKRTLKIAGIRAKRGPLIAPDQPPQVPGQVRLSLPFPPSVNNLYAVARGRKIKSDRGREYEEFTVNLIRQSIGCSLDSPRFTHDVDVVFYAVFPDRRRHDIDNLQKAVFDSLTNAGVLSDDSLVSNKICTCGPVEKPGRIDIVITSATESRVPVDIFSEHKGGTNK